MRSEIRTQEKCSGCGGVYYREVIREVGVTGDLSEALGRVTRCSSGCLIEVDITGEVSAIPRR